MNSMDTEKPSGSAEAGIYEDYTAGLVMFDIIPCVLFLAAGLIIRSMFGSGLFLAGVLCAFAGSMCKVIWKAIIVFGKIDNSALTKGFRILLPAGFVMMLLSVIIHPGTGVLSGLWRGLTMWPAVLFFIVGLACMCLMGYFAGHMDKSAKAAWIEEGTNALAQLAVLIGIIIVYRGTL